MAHEITEHDNVVLHRQKAWHGLGVVVQDAPTPMEALQIAGLDWDVEQWPLSATNGDTRLLVDDRLNVRMPGAIKLGIVGHGYKVVQNREMAQFCQDLAEMNDVVKVESAGSIRGGKKIWFLLKGESFTVRSSDHVEPYICVSNGHDGGTAIRATPTSVRVVCSNTLMLVIPDNERSASPRIKPTAFQISHVGDPTKRIEEAKMILRLYGRSLDSTREMIDQLAAREVGRESVQRFWLECYTRTVGKIADVPTTLILVTRSKTVSDFEAYRGADTHILPSQISDTMLSNAAIFHTTCFALSLNPAQNTILDAASRATTLGCRLSIDVNYAQKIW